MKTIQACCINIASQGEHVLIMQVVMWVEIIKGTGHREGGSRNRKGPSHPQGHAQETKAQSEDLGTTKSSNTRGKVTGNTECTAFREV